MLRTIVGFAIIAVGAGCSPADVSYPPKGGAGMGSAGAGGSAHAGAGGTSSVTGGSGTMTNPVGSAGSGGGNAGNAGGDTADAAVATDDAASQGDGNDGRVPFIPCDGGTTYSGMSLHLDGSNSYATLPRPV